MTASPVLCRVEQPLADALRAHRRVDGQLVEPRARAHPDRDEVEVDEREADERAVAVLDEATPVRSPDQVVQAGRRQLGVPEGRPAAGRCEQPLAGRHHGGDVVGLELAQRHACDTGTVDLRLATGIAGPAAFIGAWVVGGAVKDGYSPVSDAISRLAEQGASTQPLMTAGFVSFGVLVPVYAKALGEALSSPGTRWAVTASGLGTLAVACFPLSVEGGTFLDSGHTVAAGAAYVANVIAPLAAARHLRSRRLKAASYALSAVMAACLAGSLRFDDVTGLLQRTGLTLFDVWAVIGAIALSRAVSSRT